MVDGSAEAVRLWQQCPFTSSLTCSMDPDHMPMIWDERGFLICTDPECGFIRYDINPQILRMKHGERHHGCSYG